MQPFQLVFELGSNISLRGYALHLDGLLSNVCFRHTGCTEKALTMLDDLLLFNEEHGIFHASALAFGVTPQQSIIARTRHYVSALHHGKDLRDDTLSPLKVSLTGKEQYRKINIFGGPEKQKLNKYQAYYSPYVVFHGVGNITLIDRLVQFHCSRLGVNANSGSGTINHMEIKEVGQDYSFIDAHGQVARNLPVSFFQEGLPASSDGELNLDDSEPLPVRSPYWQSHQRFSTVEAVAVEKIRRVLI